MSTEMTNDSLNDSERKKLSFVVGGVGDGVIQISHSLWHNLTIYAGRHGFATLIDFGQSLCSKRFHLTLIDIHPSSIARILLILQLLQNIRSTKDANEKMELYATVTFIYVALVMPPYCETR
jgi:hypothetical protein